MHTSAPAIAASRLGTASTCMNCQICFIDELVSKSMCVHIQCVHETDKFFFVGQ